MSKRKILSAAKLKDVRLLNVEWGWTPTPSESVPVWSISVDPDDADDFGIDAFRQFANTAEVLEWISELKRLPHEAGEKL